MTTIEKLSPFEILFLTIVGEARGEVIEGKVAVGCVMRNRMHSHPEKYKNYKDVCLKPKQFSCWNLNDPNRAKLLDIGEQILLGIPLKTPSLRECMFVARGIDSWELIDNTNNSDHYMTRTLFESSDRPSWAAKPTQVLSKGNHIFLRL